MTNKRNRTLSVLVAMAALVVGLPSVSAAASDSEVRVSEGRLRGVVTAEHRSFKGIPYAAPPVGPLRWRAPLAPAKWQGVRDATQQGAACAQLGVAGSSEDCLFLNVTTPRKTTGPLPVLVFMHGGGLISGYGAAYDPRRMVDHQAIVVTVNYRLGAFGFLKHPALDDRYTGNFGLADQQAALRWVRHNIEAFGGDKRNVTLWGQSAGGVTVCSQLAAPDARGLFDKAIVQSAPCGNDVLDPPTATSRGLSLAAEVGCAEQNDAERCLRDTPVEKLVRPADYVQTFQTLHHKAVGKTWLPVAETAALPMQPLIALQRGKAADVPLILGGTKHEMRSHVAAAYVIPGKPVSVTEYPQIVRGFYGRDADRILAAYPVGDYDSPSLALATLLTDQGANVGACSQLSALNAATRGAPVYGYEYAQSFGEHVNGFPYGAYHGADISLLLDRTSEPALTPEKLAFAEKLITHWIAFAKDGDPQWPAYRRGSATVQSLTKDQSGPVDLATEHRCGFWRSV